MVQNLNGCILNSNSFTTIHHTPKSELNRRSYDTDKLEKKNWLLRKKNVATKQKKCCNKAKKMLRQTKKMLRQWQKGQSADVVTQKC